MTRAVSRRVTGRAFPLKQPEVNIVVELRPRLASQRKQMGEVCFESFCDTP